MVKIIDNAITMTRGDTLRATVTITRDGEAYTPVTGDTVRFALKRDVLNGAKTEYKDAEPLVLKDIPIDTLLLQLDPEDTKHLGFGSYVYDIQITFADGSVDTFIAAQKLVLSPEVE